MLRRTLLAATLGVWPALAWAQTTTPPAAAPPPTPPPPPPIQPQNALENAFLMALHDERARPSFRRYLMETHVALALMSNDQDAPPREVRVRDGFRAAAIFTSAARLQSVLGANAPHIVINGRAALTRCAGKNVVINPGLVPMLTLEPRDLAQYLATQGESSAGPSQ